MDASDWATRYMEVTSVHTTIVDAINASLITGGKTSKKTVPTKDPVLWVAVSNLPLSEGDLFTSADVVWSAVLSESLLDLVDIAHKMEKGESLPSDDEDLIVSAKEFIRLLRPSNGNMYP
jgi:hypothetical protein